MNGNPNSASAMPTLRVSRYRQLCILLTVYGLYLFGFSGAFMEFTYWPTSLPSTALLPIVYMLASLASFRRWRLPLIFALTWPAIFTVVHLVRARAGLLVPSPDFIGPILYAIRVLMIVVPAALLYVVATAYRDDTADCLFGKVERTR